MRIGGKTFVFNKDFYALVDGTFAAPIEVQPVFVGYGIGADAYSDITNAGDLKGKDLVMLMSEPKGKDGQPLLPVGLIAKGLWSKPKIYPDIPDILANPEGGFARLQDVPALQGN